ncbi:Dual-specificity RNA methyltransferase RlmN [Balamuthia mandrillaris]
MKEASTRSCCLRPGMSRRLFKLFTTNPRTGSLSSGHLHSSALFRSFSSSSSASESAFYGSVEEKNGSESKLLRWGTQQEVRSMLGLEDSNSFGGKKNLVGLGLEEMTEEMATLEWDEWRSCQLYSYIYRDGVKSFSKMLLLPKAMKAQLEERYVVDYGTAAVDTISEDGTRKWLMNFSKGSAVESVFIPETSRGTLCVSSQVGCTVGCSFCHTGTQPVERNLKTWEIVGQVMQARAAMGEFPLSSRKLVSNVVFMGQGEPLYNYRNVVKAIKILSEPRGCQIGKSKITVSTSGVVPNIYRLAQDLKQIQLAISLHAVRNELRDELVPLNRQYPLEELLEACRAFGKVVFEYVMLKGVNDSEAEAHELVRIAKTVPCVVNLIPFNPWPGSKYECSDREQILKFSSILEQSYIKAPIRWPRGRDILAACGQLKTETQKAAERRARAEALAALHTLEEDEQKEVGGGKEEEQERREDTSDERLVSCSAAC